MKFDSISLLLPQSEFIRCGQINFDLKNRKKNLIEISSSDKKTKCEQLPTIFAAPPLSGISPRSRDISPEGR